MSEISGLYSSSESIYQTGAKKRSSKELNGDVKHIVFKDGKPVHTEVIQLKRHSEESEDQQSGSGHSKSGQKRKRIISSPRNTEEVLAEKKKKLADKLRRAMTNSETLWSEKAGLWISYQGNQQFLVKRYSESSQLLDRYTLSSQDIVESDIPGILTASWKKI